MYKYLFKLHKNNLLETLYETCYFISFKTIFCPITGVPYVIKLLRQIVHKDIHFKIEYESTVTMQSISEVSPPSG